MVILSSCYHTNHAIIIIITIIITIILLGPKPTSGKNVTVHCTGYGKNGDLSVPFWSTKDPGQQPFTFTIGRKEVIKGW